MFFIGVVGFFLVILRFCFLLGWLGFFTLRLLLNYMPSQLRNTRLIRTSVDASTGIECNQ